jgi:hypothetical protein
MRHNRDFEQPRRPTSKVIRVFHGTPLYNNGPLQVALLGLWMKGCFFATQGDAQSPQLGHPKWFCGFKICGAARHSYIVQGPII